MRIEKERKKEEFKENQSGAVTWCRVLEVVFAQTLIGIVF